MQILRIVNVQVIDSTNIAVTFTESLTPNLVPANVTISSDTLHVPDSQVLKVSITTSTLSIECLPLSPSASYFLEFQSVPQHLFESLNGDAIISPDGVSNRFLITAPLPADDPFINYLGSYFNGNIYNIEDPESVVSQYINSLATNLSRALYDIGQAKNENYLSFNVIDELHTRGAGPFDRLVEEGAYEILRVGLTPGSATASSSLQFSTFPSYPVTLQTQNNTETLSVNSIDTAGAFNINDFTLNLSNSPVTRVDSIVFNLNTVHPVYTYNINTLGYQIQDSRYAQDFGSSYLPLTTSQIRLNEAILSDPLFSISNIVNVVVTYESKNLGIVVDPVSVSVYSTQTSIRETLPPIINIFSLQHAPITSSDNSIPTLGGITFVDPNSNNSSPHPAFVVELPFRLNGLPASPGQYSIDYTSGTVYVYGADSKNDGTGPSPPLATYQYRLVYKSEIDYVYDPDLLDIVSLPLGSLRGFAGSVSFNYEIVLVPGVDYVAQLHIEELSERIDNRLVALNTITTTHSPVTNVFKIFNETSGEIYTLDRWNDNKIYFRYNSPPRINALVAERATFNVVGNELLFINSTLVNTFSLKVFKIFLNNNTIIANTEDCLASFFNTSMSFSNNNVFVNEKWFDREFSESANVNRLTSVGQYMVDYANGVVYCAVSSSQNGSIGTVTYKNNSITPQFPHLISVDDLYYQISVLNPKNKYFSYTSFSDGSISPNTPDPSDELFLNNTPSAPYQIFNGSVGIFVNSGFLTGVTNQVKFIRSVFEYTDLMNSTAPLNFATTSTSNGANISVSSLTGQTFGTVQFDGTNYFVLTDQNIPYLSPNITYTFSVVRLSDSLPLWNSSGTVVTGAPVKLILPNINSPNVGDQVSITHTFTINNISRVVVDYNRGDYFVDYTYLADEIIVSYEYGDNILDFRTSLTVPASTTYYVSYRAGALRDSLLKNFGTLVNVPQLSTFDVDFDRERYRDSLTAALSSFIRGPTLSAIKNIGQVISHIEPQIVESAFSNWSLGSSLLYPESIKTTGSYQLLPAKFGAGALINSPDQTITFPINSNLRLEEGTFETWVIPQWDGLDNDASLTFKILQDGYAISADNVFVGSLEYHPNISGGAFVLNKHSNVSGTPNTKKDGVYIYYDLDPSGNFSRWYVRAIDGYADGYGDGYTSSSFKISITSTGNFYNSYSMVSPKPSYVGIFTGTNSLNLSITGGVPFDQGVTFVSDVDHYILDFGQDTLSNRFSIYKDTSGYLNFRILDNEKTSFVVSSNVSTWRAGDLHHVAASWKLNTRNKQDEMHLFIDGFEVPNIIRHGQRLLPFPHEHFRTVDPEEVVGLVNRDIVASTDLHTAAGSAIVSSSLNFSSFQIFPGDTIFIDEIGFSTTGYTILTVNGQTLTLTVPLPVTLTNGRFSVNRTQFTVTSDLDIASNIAVSTIHTLTTGSDINGTSGTNFVTSTASNFTNLGIVPGYLLRIDNIALPTTYVITQVSGYILTITDNLPVNIINNTFQVYSNVENEIPGVRATRPSYSVSEDVNFNNILTVSNNVFAGDLILIRTLGLNYRKFKKQYYVWSDGYENILRTTLPPPISLDEADITKVILSPTAIGTSNSVLIAGQFNSNNIATVQPTNTITGRTLSATIAGNNANFSTPVMITINGVSGGITISETISFTAYGTLDFIHGYSAVNYISVVGTPINASRNLIVVSIKEKYPLTHGEFSGTTPIVRYSYAIGAGYTLHNDGPNSVRDENFLFSGTDIGNYLLIQSPAPVAGYYTITALSTDRKSISIQRTNLSEPQPIPVFSNGVYQVINVNSYRSGLQNGLFTFENAASPGQPYFLNHGFYELEYATYASIIVNPGIGSVYLGSDFSGDLQLNGILNQSKVYSVMLTDTRVGETLPSNQLSITKDFNSIKPTTSDINTLMLITFNAFPFVNDASFYRNFNVDKQHFQSAVVINENFNNSLVILDKPLVVENDGILDTRKQGTIEFWMNPLFDTANDPVNRFYFDAYGAVIEKTVSVDDTSVKLSSPIGSVLSVKLQAGDSNIDYFVGGKIEVDTQRAIQEEGTGTANNSVVVSHPVLQVITVKIIGDLTGKDYFRGGSVGTDQITIYLGVPLPSNNLPLLITYQTTENKNTTLNTQVIRLNRKLPYQNTPVVVTYLPQGLQGDRLSIFKDKIGYMNFAITASGQNFVVRAPTRWTRGTWHRVKASYKLNGGIGNDEMRLFLDGYEYDDVTFGTPFLFGSFPLTFGMAIPGAFIPNDGYAALDGYSTLESIIFKDPINELFIGTQYTRENPVFSLIDNFRISDVSRPIYAPYGEPIDVNYSSNLSTVFPVTKDLFTTYLMDFDRLIMLNTDFSILINRETGSFDFSVNILDSLDIVSSSIKTKEALEALIKVLKPANSRVFITYTK